jgi:hypothetical protein
MWVDGANPNTPKTPPSYSWGRFSAHISQIKQKLLKRYGPYHMGHFGDIGTFGDIATWIILAKSREISLVFWRFWQIRRYWTGDIGLPVSNQIWERSVKK